MNSILILFIAIVVAIVIYNCFACDKYEKDDLVKEGYYNISNPYWYYNYYPWRMYPRWYEYYNTPKWWRFNKWYYNRPSWWLPKY